MLFVFLAALSVLPGIKPRIGCMEDEALASMKLLQRSLEEYHDEWQVYPDTLKALNWKRLDERGPVETAFGHSYQYRRLDDGRGYELFSVGPDLAPKTLDDVIPGQRPRYCTPFYGGYSLLGTEDYGPGHDPCSTARAQISAYHSMLRTFRTNTGHYPDSLLELNSIVHENELWGGPSMFIDPWGAPYYYARVASRYELYSSGPDGISWTSDDVVSRWVNCEEPPYSRDDRDLKLGPRYRARLLSAALCITVSRSLSELSAQIVAKSWITGKLPNALTDLIDNDSVSELRRLTDPWGQRFTYKLLPSGIKHSNSPVGFRPGCEKCPRMQGDRGFLLFSNGPDRLPNTDDDLPDGFDRKKCSQPHMML